MSDRDPEGEVLLNPSACDKHHVRAGLVSNLPPDADYVPGRPHLIVSVCRRIVCQQKITGSVAQRTGQPAAYYDDAKRRAAKATQ